MIQRYIVCRIFSQQLPRFSAILFYCFFDVCLASLRVNSKRYGEWFLAISINCKKSDGSLSIANSKVVVWADSNFLTWLPLSVDCFERSANDIHTLTTSPISTHLFGSVDSVGLQSANDRWFCLIEMLWEKMNTYLNKRQRTRKLFAIFDCHFGDAV